MCSVWICCIFVQPQARHISICDEYGLWVWLAYASFWHRYRLKCLVLVCGSKSWLYHNCKELHKERPHVPNSLCNFCEWKFNQVWNSSNQGIHHIHKCCLTCSFLLSSQKFCKQRGVVPPTKYFIDHTLQCTSKNPEAFQQGVTYLFQSSENWRMR